MTKSNSGREKHSYVPFYMDDWQGGTAGMTRMIKSVYFDICLFNWDKCKPMTPAHYTLITQDLQEMGPAIAQLLVDTDKIVLDPERGYYSPRALAVGLQAFEVWSAKSAGGKKGGSARRGEDTQSSPSSTPLGDIDDTSNIQPSMAKESDHNQNQNQNHLVNTDVLTVRDSEKAKNTDSEEDENALAKIKAAQAKSAELTVGSMRVVEAWNTMSAMNGLPNVAKITEGRMKKLRSRVGDYGADAIIEAIGKVPNVPFLMGTGSRGWKASLDFILRPDTVTKIQEGQYHGEQPKEPATGNGFLDAVINAERAGGTE